MLAEIQTTPPHGHSTNGPVTCQNCDHEFTGRYCSQCGQRADTHRINWHYIWHEIPHSVWHVDSGILFTLRELFTRPGHTIRDFLSGKRVKHYRPLALLLILGAVLVFTAHSLDVNLIKSTQEAISPTAAEASSRAKGLQTEVNDFAERNQTLINIAIIPFYALWLWAMFRRRGYNYPELLVAQTFIANFGLVTSLAVTLLFWALDGSPMVAWFAVGVSMVAQIGYLIVVCLQLFRNKLRPVSIVMRSVAAWLLGYLTFMFIAGIIGAAYGFYIAKNDAEQTQTNIPKTTSQQPHP